MQIQKKSFESVKKVFFIFSLMVAILFTVNSAFAQDEVIFCKSITENHEPVEPAKEFSTTNLSWLAHFSQPCGAPQIMFSIYQKVNNSETILYRETMDVRPEWNYFGVKEFNFPGDGTYILAFNHLDGSIIAEGTVTIKADVAPEKAEPLPEKIEVEGLSLEAIYNKFKVSAQPTNN